MNLQSILRHRLATGVGANLVGKVWIAIIQILSIPILSRSWGADGLGTWLMLSTIPNYIGLSAAGFGNATTTDMTLNISRGDYVSAALSFHSSWILITTASVAASAIASIFAFMWFDPSSNYYVIPLLSVYAAFAIQTSMLTSVYRAIGRYALGAVILDASFFLEGIAVLAIASFGGNMTNSVACMVALRILWTVAVLIHIRSTENWLFKSKIHASFAEIKRLANPALASLSMTISNALSLQTVVVLLGLFASPVAVASYSAARTLTRLPLQAIEVINRAALPELTRARGSGDKITYERTNRLILLATFVLLAPALAAISTLGPWAFHRFSGGNILFEPLLFPVMCLVVLIQGLWSTLSQGLTSFNIHHRFSYPYLALSGGVAASPVLFGNSTYPCTWVAAATLIAEAVMLGLVWRLSKTDARRWAPIAVGRI